MAGKTANTHFLTHHVITLTYLLSSFSFPVRNSLDITPSYLGSMLLRLCVQLITAIPGFIMGAGDEEPGVVLARGAGCLWGKQDLERNSQYSVCALADAESRNCSAGSV